MTRRLVKRTKKQKLCTLGDLWKCYSLGTADEATIAAMQPSKQTARKVLDELEAAGNEWGALAAYAKRQGWTSQRKLQIGEERGYVVQQNGQMLFLRVPVDTLGVTKGMTLSVQVQARAIIIRKPLNPSWTPPKVRTPA